MQKKKTNQTETKYVQLGMRKGNRMRKAENYSIDEFIGMIIPDKMVFNENEIKWYDRMFLTKKWMEHIKNISINSTIDGIKNFQRQRIIFMIDNDVVGKNKK